MYPYNKKLVTNAKTLRKNMTPEEKKLWYNILKKLPVQVKRQKNLGSYIVDFYIPSHRIVIELDGVQHLEKNHKEADAVRDEYLNSLGIKVLRYNNDDISRRFNIVAENILYHLNLTALDLLNEQT